MIRKIDLVECVHLRFKLYPHRIYLIVVLFPIGPIRINQPTHMYTKVMDPMPVNSL